MEVDRSSSSFFLPSTLIKKWSWQVSLDFSKGEIMYKKVVKRKREEKKKAQENKTWKQGIELFMCRISDLSSLVTMKMEFFQNK